MINIFLAPHSDDEALFGSYIIQRTKPLIVVCTDGTGHEKRFGIPTQRRRDESIAAAKIFGVEVKFLGIAEEDLTVDILLEKLIEARIQLNSNNCIFAPTKTGGQPQHDIVSDTVKKIGESSNYDIGFPLYYGTYTRENFSPTGEMAIIPTEEEKRIKEEALTCFTSQHGINKPHFDAVKDVPEYLSFKQ